MDGSQAYTLRKTARTLIWDSDSKGSNCLAMVE